MNNSEKLFKRACNVIPGGVNSPVRAFNSVGGTPVFIRKGEGCRIYDADDKTYIDFCSSWGPLILGHADPDVLKAVKETAENGLTFGACTPLEVEMAELLAEMVPEAEMFRLVNSGTEAVMTALRLARGYTGKNYIIKFDGCYHGHSDSLLVNAGSGLLTGNAASSGGVTANITSEMISIPYNDTEALEDAFAKYAEKIAGVIIEPLAGNMGLIKPDISFLRQLRKLCSSAECCLIFDEVITGFRFHPGAYADLLDIKPDIMTFGKIIGGGMPIGAIAGSKEIMKNLAPEGEVYQAGTLSGNPVAVAAGIATLKKLRTTNPYPAMAALTERFAERINSFAVENKIPAHCAYFGSAFTLFFSAEQPLKNLDDVKKCDTEMFAAYHRYMLNHGFYMPPSQFELNFISAAHTEEEVNAAAECALEFIKSEKSSLGNRKSDKKEKR